MNTQRIRFVAPCKVILEDITIAELEPKQVLLKSICSAISPGSERLIYRGHFPKDQPIDLNFKDQKKTFSYPMSYGYCLVGEIIATGSEISSRYLGKRAFVFQPHQAHAVCSFEELILLPADLDPFDACFLANCETACNLVLDTRPLLGERIAVIGQGIVGHLTQKILQKFPLENIIVIDSNPQRLDIARAQGDVTALLPTELDDYWQSCDAVIELSGHLPALETAVNLCRYDGRVIVGSWYGENQQPISLNTYFHRMHLKIISSQVSQIAPDLRGRFDKKRRMSTAMQVIKEQNPKQLISHRVPFTENMVRETYQSLNQAESAQLQVVFTYHHD
ncbi:MAG: zinc-binding dehydrogenase [Oligoflexus sp.]